MIHVICSIYRLSLTSVEWTRGMCVDCGNVDSPEDDKEDTMDINVIILMFPNPTFSGNMVTCKASANV